MKKISVLVVTVFLLTIIGAFPGFADEEISAVLGTEAPTCSNMTVSMPTGGTVTTKQIGGKTGWVLLIKKVVDSYVLKNASLFANISDDVMYRLSGAQTVCVEVEYFDAGGGNFCIGYDSTTVSEKNGGVINLGNTETWKTAVFELERPFFGNRLSKNDFVLRIKSDYMKASSSEVVIASVKVTSGNTRPLDIRVSSNETGNIFFDTKKPQLSISMRNLSKQDYNFDIEYLAINKESGEEVFRAEESMRIISGTTYSKELVPDVVQFGMYEMIITATTGQGYTCVQRTEFSKAKSSDKTDSHYGVCLHFSGSRSESETTAALNLIGNGGFKYARDALHWNKVEKSAGKYQIPENMMREIDLANSNGIDILLILGYVNNNAYPDLRHYTKTDIDAEDAEAQFEEYLDAYENYVYNTVLLLGDKIKYYEIGNEYNLEIENTVYPDEGIHNEVTDYARILERAYRAIKKANSNAVVVGGALAQDGSEIPEDYITRLYELGAADWMDALSIHFYTEASPDSTSYKIHDQLSLVRNIMNEYGNKQELWASEYCSVSRKGGLSQHTQAVYAAKSEILLKVKGLSDKSFWYMLHSSMPASDDLYNTSYGLLNCMSDENEEVSVTFAAKPAYLAVAAHKSILAGTEFAGDLSEGDNYIYRFTDDSDKSYWALWNKSKNNVTVTLDTGFKEILIHDMYGNAQKLSSDTGSFDLTIGKEPVYVSECEENIWTAPIDNYKKFELTGFFDAGELPITVAVLKPDKTYEDFKTNPLTSLAYMDMLKTDKDGSFKTQFRLSGNNGTYTVLIKPSDRQEITQLAIRYSSTLFDVNYKIIQAEKEIDSPKSIDFDKPVTLSADIDNTYSLSTTGTLIVAFMEDNRLIGAHYKQEQIRSDEDFKTITDTVSVSKFKGADTIKLFLLDDFDSIRPLAKSKSVSDK